MRNSVALQGESRTTSLRRGRSNGALSDIRVGAERRNSQMTYLQREDALPELCFAHSDLPQQAGDGDLLLAMRGYVGVKVPKLVGRGEMPYHFSRHSDRIRCRRSEGTRFSNVR